MSLDQENFEKLESYVDGTSDAEGKAQMQKLLAENPQLQQMLTELIAQRQMLRNLPRVQAPEDLLESFQGQLEREALLGEPVHNLDAPARRVERWPHMVLAAAIVFLVLGLAGLIYEVLPRHRETIPLVYGPGSGVNVGPDTESNEPATRPSDSTLGLSSRSVTGFNSFEANKFPSTQSDDQKQPSPIAGADFKLARENPLTLATTSPSDEPVVIVVRSGYPVQAAVQVTEFLSSNKIAFETSSSAGLENRQSLQQTGEATTAPIALGNLKPALRQQFTSSENLKDLSVTRPSPVVAAQTDEDGVIQNKNALADRNAPSPSQEAASGQITYRAMLTEQQLQRLNAQLLNQPNQWTEVRGENSGRVLSDALPPNAMQNAMSNARAQGPAILSPTTHNAPGVAPAATALPSLPPATTQATKGLAIGDDAIKFKASAYGGGFTQAFALTTQPTTEPSTAPSRLRACVIIVNAQPVDFPAPATEPATLPATAPASQPLPATQP